MHSFTFLTVQLPYHFLPAGISTVDLQTVNISIHLPYYLFCSVSTYLLTHLLNWHHISLHTNKLALRNTLLCCHILIITVITDTITGNLFMFFKNCFSPCLCHTNLLFQIVIFRFSISIIYLNLLF